MLGLKLNHVSKRGLNYLSRIYTRPALKGLHHSPIQVNSPTTIYIVKTKKVGSRCDTIRRFSKIFSIHAARIILEDDIRLMMLM